MLPLLKWPGGKRWAAKKLLPLLQPRSIRGRYFEPFLGGAAVFFELLPENAYLSDLNPELIEMYRVVKHRSTHLIRSLRQLSVDQETYYRTRALMPRHAIARASRFLYLNRTAFGGLYRVNRAGQFNVPFGGGQRTHSILWEQNLIKRASDALSTARLAVCDFEVAMKLAKNGDVVYCDPTYTVAHDNNGFIRYNERNFTWKDQERLAKAAKAAAARGATVVVSNAYHTAIAALYKEADTFVFERTCCMPKQPSLRRSVSEYAFVLK